MPVPPSRRASRPPALALALVLLALLLAGCGQVRATVRTTGALADAGIKDPVVAVETDAGVKTVTVDYRSMAASMAELADEQERIARIVWRTMPLEIDLLRIDQDGGPADASPSRSFDRTEMAARFGPRPARLDRNQPGPSVRLGFVLVFILALVALVLAVAAVIWWLYFRNRRATDPPWLSGPGYPGWERFEGPAAGPVPPAPPASYPAATPGHPGYPQARGAARPGGTRAESWPAEDDTATDLPVDPGPADRDEPKR
jgi:hypothetical protein